jgi:hypothetical protein
MGLRIRRRTTEPLEPVDVKKHTLRGENGNVYMNLLTLTQGNITRGSSLLLQSVLRGVVCVITHFLVVCSAVVSINFIYPFSHSTFTLCSLQVPWLSRQTSFYESSSSKFKPPQGRRRSLGGPPRRICPSRRGIRCHSQRRK